MNRLEEIQARLAAIATEIETATGDALTALETEVANLTEERNSIEAENTRRQQLRSNIAAGAQPGVQTVVPAEPSSVITAEEREAQNFAETRRMTVGTEQARAVLISGGTLATPTEVSGINDVAGAHVSSIIDMVTVENTEGMSADRVAYIAADAAAAANQTEGSAATAKEPTFGYKDITPTSVAVTAQISKQAKKQTPLLYSAKVRSQALLSLRKNAAALVTTKLQASTLATAIDGAVVSGKGVINEKTLRALVLGLGGDEGVNAGVLFLNKADLIAFGDVRGTNEKKAVYEIIPDGANPNVGVIKDGGLTVRYCINSNLTAFHGTAQAASSGAAKKTMFYGDPKAIKLDLFSKYEIRVSEDFAFTSLMDTIVGDVEIGADLVQANAFVYLNLPKAS